MTSLHLCAPPVLDLARVAKILRRYGLEVRLSELAEKSILSASEADAVVLIDPEIGIGRLAEGLACGTDNSSTEVLVCAPIPGYSERQILEQYGARTIVEPADWGAVAVAERILAELILAGHIERSSSGSLKGAAMAMRRTYDEIAALAPLKDAVLILGETGVGKSMAAREIHRLSGRPDNFIDINVAELSRDLMASDLFGHEQGAFTGAFTKRKGLLAEAGEGTVLLDEIGDLDLPSQAKLLKVLEDFRVRPVGGNKWQSVAGRVLLATNIDLDEACHEGRFRRDLYERIRGLPIHVPPLRERKADIPLLARHFLADFNRENGGSRWIPLGALESLFRHDWPGNVRELKQLIRQAAAFAASEEGPISRERLRDVTRGRPERKQPDGSRQSNTSSGETSAPFSVTFDPEADTLKDVRKRAEAHYLQSVLVLTEGDKPAAADKAGISLSRFYDLLKKPA